jgi:hypothetical protein
LFKVLFSQIVLASFSSQSQRKLQSKPRVGQITPLSNTSLHNNTNTKLSHSKDFTLLSLNQDIWVLEGFLSRDDRDRDTDKFPNTSNKLGRMLLNDGMPVYLMQFRDVILIT